MCVTEVLLTCVDSMENIVNIENLPLSLSDVTKEYSKPSHIISKETFGMEKAMTEYLAYKAGKRGDPVAHLKGVNPFLSRSNKLYTLY